MQNSIDLSPYEGQTVNISWTQSDGGRLEDDDGLDYAFSGDGGTSWGSYQQAFRNDISATVKTIPIPSQYLTGGQFKLRFYLVGCSEGSYTSQECAYIDEIRISLTGSPVEYAKVNQIMFNGIKVTANPADPRGCQTQQSGASGAPNSLSYACFSDVTALVLGMIQSGALGSNGSGTYTVGHVLDWPGEYQMYNFPGGTLDGTTAFPLGTPAKRTGSPPSFLTKYQWSYAAWSLVTVYSSPETQGHQLYLYDEFRYCDSYETLDFSIGGFLAPEAIKDADHAARLTCFVGEGDDAYDYDFINVNGTKLWDGTTTGGNSQSSPNDVWNSNSVGLTQSGIDIDTFTVTYPTIKPGEVVAQVLIDTNTDSWNLIYIILSFRSEIVPASTISYLVK